MSKAAAFFDLDKTLMAGSSGMQFARVAARGGVVSRRQLWGWGVEHLRYRLRGTTDEKTTEVLRVARELITGVSAKTIERMGPEVMAAILPRVYPQMLEEVHAHQDAGRPTFIVSAAGNDVVESLAAVLGMEGGIGTRYEVDVEGHFTDLIQKKGAVIGQLEFADAAFEGAGETATFMTEQFAFDEVSWDGGAVDLYHQLAFPRGGRVDGAGYQLFSRACFSYEEDGGIGVGHLGDEPKDFF